MLKLPQQRADNVGLKAQRTMNLCPTAGMYCAEKHTAQSSQSRFSTHSGNSVFFLISPYYPLPRIR